MIFTSAIGKFEFADDVVLSHAKLIRDAIVGQWLNPKPNTNRLTEVKDAYEYVFQHMSNVLSGVEFALVLTGDAPISTSDEVLEDLPKLPMVLVDPVWVRQTLVGTARPAWLDA